MDNSLNFLKTFTINEFKEQQGIEQLDIVRNPNSGKLFLGSNGKSIGTVSTQADLENDVLVISQVQDTNGEEFHMLHKSSTDNVVKSL